METTKLQAEVREGRGKGPARRLRAQGLLPAVVYGPELKPTPLTVDPKALEAALKGRYGRNTLFEIAVGDDTHMAMVRDVEVEPVSRAMVHVDFLRVIEDAPVSAEIPLRATGRAVGVVKGGKLNVTRRSVPVRSAPRNIPAEIVIDVTKLDMFQTISVKDLKLPEGVEATLAPDLTLAIIIENKRAAKDAEEGAAAPGEAPAAAAEKKPEKK